MIISTTPNLEGHEISEYRGVVFGEVINGIDFIHDISAHISNVTGGRSPEYEQEMVNARADALTEMCQCAEKVGANAVVGVDVRYEPININDNVMLMVTASGTAVIIDKQ